ncbi:hypothetical protein [Daejeonella lutea]|uniref:LPXTG-motif cell wall anchor domain-containing protein n=1 Tax=Daejeonella lutea TaxID=572036 RepID=A0A1T5A807_9SPHI|nr:hypothetical protein [Daejeonella lutea]SKB31045.1 hypothetical protein SAMN05661099_0422 [Daejeonella lutea]
MEINYPIAGLILLIAIIVIILMIKRNRKDQKNFEKAVNESEIKPEEHKDIDPI